MAGAGSLFLDIIPRVVGLGTTISREAIPEAERGGTQAGASFGNAFARGVATSSAQTNAAVQRSVREAQLAVEQASLKVAAARDKEVTAAERVRVAEAQLAEARTRYAADSSKVLAAEARLQAARRSGEAASRDLTVAEMAQGNAQTELVARNDALAASNGRNAASAEAVKKSYSGLSAVVTGAVVVGMGVVAVKAAANFQTQLTKLVTTAGESDTRIKAVGQGMLDMAGQVGISAQHLAEGMYTVESAGFHGADALTVLKSAAQGAKQEGAELSSVTDAVTTALHDFHLPASDAANVTSQLVTAVSHGKTTFDDLTSAMHSVTPLAAASGMSLAQVSGALSSMTASGMHADQAAQNLASSIRSFSKPTQPMINELAQLGINAQDLSQHLGDRGVAGTLQIVSNAIVNHLDPATKKVLLPAFNQSKVAAEDAKEMYSQLPPEIQKLADSYTSGTMSVAGWRAAVRKLPADQLMLANSWKTMQDKAAGFSQILKSGGPEAQTYTAALGKAVGTSEGLSVALQLTGENANATNAAIADIAKSGAQADGSIKGWDEVQGNFNQKLDETTAGIKSWTIELGQALMPAATRVLGVIQDIVDWLTQHQTAVRDTVLVVGGLLAVWAEYTIAVKAAELATTAFKFAQGGASIALKLLTGDMAAFSAAADANPFGIIVLAITALVIGLVEAYRHVGWFHDGVNAAWNGIKVAAVAVFNWFKDSALPALQSFWDGAVAGARWLVSGIETAWRDIKFAWEVNAAALRLLYTSVIQPVFDWFASAAHWLWEKAIQPVANFIQAAFHDIAFALQVVWNGWLNPIVQLAAAIFHWLWDTAVSLVGAWIRAEITAWGTILSWTWDNVLHPVISAIAGVFHWLWDTAVSLVGGWIRAEITAWGTVLSWTWDNVLHPVLGSFGTTASDLWNVVIKPAWDAIKEGWNELGGALKSVWDNTIAPLFGYIKDTALENLKQAFRDTMSDLGTIWNGLKDIVLLPVKFVVETVLNDGLIAAFNWIAGFFHTPTMSTIPTGWLDGPAAPGAGNIKVAGGTLLKADGGYISGPGTGTSDSIPARLSNGEFVVNASATAGNLALLEAMNSGKGFADGGLVGTIGGWLSSAAGSVGGALKDSAAWLASPASKLTDAVTGMLGDLGTNQMGQLLIAGVKSLTSSAGSFLSGLVQPANSTGGPYTGPVPTGGNVTRWAPLVTQVLGELGLSQAPDMVNRVLRQIQTESSGNPNAIQGNIGDVNNKTGDLARGLMQVIGSTFRRWAGPYLSLGQYDPHASIYAGLNYAMHKYGPGLSFLGKGHGYAEGGLVRPSAVLTSGQVSRSTVNRGVTIHGGVHGMSADSIAAAIERRQRNRAALTYSGR